MKLSLDFTEQIFAAVLGLYMENGTQSLPNSDEVLICTSETTAEEVFLPLHIYMPVTSNCQTQRGWSWDFWF